MSSAAAIAAAFLTIAGAGLGLATLLGQRRGRITDLLALGWFAGSGFVSLALWTFGFLLRGVALHSAVTVCCAILTVIGVRSLRGKSWARVEARSPLEIALGILIALEFAAIVYGSLQHTLGWDGLLIWELKARYAFENGGAVPASYFTDETRTFTHPEYPLGLPMIETWLYLWLGEPHQFWAKLVSPAFYLAGAIMLANAAAEVSRSRVVGLSFAALFVFIPAVNSAPGSILVGYADLPLGFTFLAAVRYILRYARSGERADAITFCALAALLPWLKRDGMVLWAVAVCVGAVLIFKRSGWKLAGVSLVPGLAVIGAWSLFLSVMNAAAPADFIRITPETVVSNLPRVGPILKTVAAELCEPSRWSIFWFAVALAFACATLRAAQQTVGLLVVLVCLPLMLYAATYVFSSWPDYLGHIEASLPRLLLQLSPVACLAIALALRKEERDRKHVDGAV